MVCLFALLDGRDIIGRLLVAHRKNSWLLSARFPGWGIHDSVGGIVRTDPRRLDANAAAVIKLKVSREFGLIRLHFQNNAAAALRSRGEHAGDSWPGSLAARPEAAWQTMALFRKRGP